jgi:DNA-binding response OmpR family regulator
MGEKMKVLLIEDDRLLSRSIKKVLEKYDFDVTHIEDGAKAFDEILNNSYDLYLLDINLPEIDGLKLLKLIRNKEPDAIVMMITASANIDDMEEAYKNGCDEYIKKPFHINELILRIEHWLKIKKSEPEPKKEEENNIIEIENMKFNFDTLDLYINGEFVNLRKKEKLLLAILLKNIGKTVSKEDIIKYVWKENTKKEYPLRQLVSELKNKLPKNYITSVVGIGYRFDKKD